MFLPTPTVEVLLDYSRQWGNQGTEAELSWGSVAEQEAYYMSPHLQVLWLLPTMQNTLVQYKAGQMFQNAFHKYSLKSFKICVDCTCASFVFISCTFSR